MYSEWSVVESVTAISEENYVVHVGRVGASCPTSGAGIGPGSYRVTKEVSIE